MNPFARLGLVNALQQNVLSEGYTEPTPIQTQAIPHVLAGRDLLGCARTGTGKTAAFALPILQRLAEHPAPSHAIRALVLVPTRELAAQVAESFTTYGRGLGLRVAVIFGGVGQGPQVSALRRGVDVLVATPGRLIDLMGQKHVRLDRVEVLVLDEADHMLDLGFIPDVRRVLAAVPKKRQTLFFSATMPPPIAELASTILHQPERVTVTPPATTVESVEQSVHFVSREGKQDLLEELLRDPAVERALVFTRTKHGADRVARRLARAGIEAVAIHGNKSQGQRERTMKGFKSGRTPVLVATDIAARGIDVDNITHVFNFELPNVPESYVHRIGRTARAGATGVAVSLCDDSELEHLADIEKTTRKALTVASGTRGRAGHAHRPTRDRGPTYGSQRPEGRDRPYRERTRGGSGQRGRGGRGPAARTHAGHAPARQAEYAPAERSHAPRAPERAGASRAQPERHPAARHAPHRPPTRHAPANRHAPAHKHGGGHAPRSHGHADEHRFGAGVDR